VKFGFNTLAKNLWYFLFNILQRMASISRFFLSVNSKIQLSLRGRWQKLKKKKLFKISLKSPANWACGALTSATLPFRRPTNTKEIIASAI